jgi:hypothetical protein
LTSFYFSSARGSGDIVVYHSGLGGEQYGYRILVQVAELSDGTFVTTTYGHWEKGEEPYILSVRFRLEEMDKRAGEKMIE